MKPRIRVRLHSLLTLAVLNQMATVGASVRLAPGSGPADCAIPLFDDKCESWTATYDNGSLDIQTSIVLDPDGSRAYVTGYSIGNGPPQYDTSFDIATAAFDTGTGQLVWTARYDGPASRGDAGMDIAISPDGNRVYVSGTQDFIQTTSDGSGDFVTIAYDAGTGIELWSSVFAGEGGLNDRVGANAVGTGPSGDRVYVTGRSLDPEIGYRYATIALDGETGSTLWEALYDPGFTYDGPFEVIVSQDGARVFVAGESGDQPDFLTMAFDSGINDTPDDRRGGNRLWVARYDGPAGAWDMPKALGLSPDGETLYVTGQSDRGADHQVAYCGDCDYTTVAYNAATGTRRWVGRFAGSEGAEAADIFGFPTSQAVDPLGRFVYVAGESVGPQGTYVVVAHHASTGGVAWTSTYPGELPWDLAVSPDGSKLFATGAQSSTIGFYNTAGETRLVGDAVTVSYDAATGSQLWAARHNSSPARLDSWTQPFFIWWRSLAVGPESNRVYVARTIFRTDELLTSEDTSDFGLLLYEA